MTDWTSIPNTVLETGKPIRAVDGRALRDNPIAIAEGAPGAPKIKTRTFVSGAAAQTQTFTGLGDYSGIQFMLYGDNVGAATYTLQFQFSSDGGATWSTASTIQGVSSGTGSRYFSAHGHFNFETGLFAVIGETGGGPWRASTTLSGASLAIDAIRFTSNNVALTNLALIIPNGGTV